MNLKNKEQLLKTKKMLEQRLANFERRNNNLEGNFVGQIINLKRRIREIDFQMAIRWVFQEKWWINNNICRRCGV